MALYKILLVDDEEEVRHTIATKLDWAALGFSVVGEVSNGIEALEMIETFSPDVVMTDIQMPFMDGLTLCKHVREILPDVRFVIFSGFDEFDYARAAIKLDVIEYIMKPIDAAELSAIFNRIRDSLDRETSERLDRERIRKLFDESLPILRQQLLGLLLSGRPAREDLLNEGEMGLDAPRYGVAAVRWSPDIVRNDLSEDDIRLLPYSLQRMLDEMLVRDLRFVPVLYPDHIVLVFLLDAEADARNILSHFPRLVSAAGRRFGMRLSIGLGNVKPHIAEIAYAYEEALDALACIRLSEDTQIAFIGDIAPDAGERDRRSSLLIEQIIRQINAGDKEGLTETVAALLGGFRNKPPNRFRCRYFLIGLGNAFSELAEAYGLEAMSYEAEIDELLAMPDLQRRVTDDDMGVRVGVWADEIRRAIKEKRSDSTAGLARDAQAYIDAHYADGALSLESIAEHLNVSVSYFSVIFKKATGKSFVTMLTEVRMNAAVRLLMETDEKTYIIAERVGYSDPNYFSYVFKKHFGVSPTKYRSERLAD